ncbi:MAG: YgiQ family radical SAM protein [Oligoflexia bacterium]|nr:YgiQ family radical SAM protein [Oligoflexia bacterium]
MFIPTTKEELEKLKWKELDVILVSGDTYIDSSYIGVSVIGQILIAAGFKVGIIAQPAVDSEKDITRLGEPKLFWGVSSGSMDSLVANYTASLKKRKQDDFTPGTINNKRPDRALIAYSNLIKKYFKKSKCEGETSAPIILGGVEATLRRFSHYDYWSNKVRRSILLDSKADILVYGMGERAIVEIANCLKNKLKLKNIRGIMYVGRSSDIFEEYLELPSLQQVNEDPKALAQMFAIFYNNNDPLNAKGLYQACDKDRFIIQNPPALHLSTNELDNIYELPYQRDVHPYYKKDGEVRALNTIRFAITTHRGCYGECNFCSVAIHQGRTILSRSKESILREIKKVATHEQFKGYILDLGGPTANMYGGDCEIKLTKGACINKRCLFPKRCENLPYTHDIQLDLLGKVSEEIDNNNNNNKIKKAFIASGIRFDIILEDEKFGIKYLEKIIKDHTSGQMKLAPEHIDENVLQLMGKPPLAAGAIKLSEFIKIFESINRKLGLKQFLTYYFMVAYPGCNNENTLELKKYLRKNIKFTPEQIQIFTPLPSTYASLIYFLEKNIFVEKNLKAKEKQKELLLD